MKRLSESFNQKEMSYNHGSSNDPIVIDAWQLEWSKVYNWYFIQNKILYISVYVI